MTILLLKVFCGNLITKGLSTSSHTCAEDRSELSWLTYQVSEGRHHSGAGPGKPFIDTNPSRLSHLYVACIWPGVKLIGEVRMDGDPSHVIILHWHWLYFAPVIVLSQADLDGDLGEGTSPPTSRPDLHTAEVYTVARCQHVSVTNKH